MFPDTGQNARTRRRPLAPVQTTKLWRRRAQRNMSEEQEGVVDAGGFHFSNAEDSGVRPDRSKGECFMLNRVSCVTCRSALTVKEAV